MPIREGVLRENCENENTDTLIPQRPMPKEACQNVYKLPTTEKVVRCLHATLGFPTKEFFLRASPNKWLVGWSGLTMERINAHFPESDKT